MIEYKNLIEDILENGTDVSDRTGVGTKCVFGRQMRFDLSKGFPATTTKKLAWNAVVGELLWFLEGSTDERRLAELTYGKNRSEIKDKKTIWTENANAQGVALGYENNDNVKELGPVYGYQWRSFGGIGGVDQILSAINSLKETPDSRRIIVTAQEPNALSKMTLPPCHVFYNFRVINGKLNCLFFMRSSDVGLGLPFNIASYALLTHLIARECKLEVGDLVVTLGDAHIYNNHIESLKEVLNRDVYDLPKLEIAEDFDFMGGLVNNFNIEDYKKMSLINYNYHPTIKMKMAV